jgi:hypothetical protein
LWGFISRAPLLGRIILYAAESGQNELLEPFDFSVENHDVWMAKVRTHDPKRISVTFKDHRLNIA